MVSNQPRCVWVLLSYRVPREPSTPRIAVWRKLKRLGVAPIGDGLVALPADARTQEQFEWLAEEIDEAGGSSTLWRGELTSAAQERALVEEMAASRRAEYLDLAHRVRQQRDFLATNARTWSDTARAIRSFRRELRRIQRRDFFPPREREIARVEVEGLARELNSHVEIVT